MVPHFETEYCLIAGPSITLIGVQTIIRTQEQKFVMIAGVLLVLIVGLYMFDSGGAYHTTTFVDAIPPEEFMTNAEDAAAALGDRRPSNAPLSAAEVLKSGKKYASLTRPERRSLYNAVMYFCNEEKDDRACKSYVTFCGKSCQMLVQSPAAK